MSFGLRSKEINRNLSKQGFPYRIISRRTFPLPDRTEHKGEESPVENACFCERGADRSRNRAALPTEELEKAPWIAGITEPKTLPCIIISDSH